MHGQTVLHLQNNYTLLAFDSNMLLLMTSASAFRKLEFCFVVWSNTSSSDIKKLQAI